MKYLLPVLMLLISAGAVAQTPSEKPEPPRYESTVGTTKPAPVEESPNMMYPAAVSEQSLAVAQDPLSVSSQIPQSREWSSVEVSLTWGLLVFTLVVLGMLVHLARNAEKPWSPQSILRVFGITLIVPLAVILVVAGYSEKQIAPVIGLLGVIAGYLLGNADRPRTGA